MKLLFADKRRKRRRGRHKKNRRHWLHHGQEWLWPSMGLYGFLRWLEITIKRTPDSTHRVAMGLAIGIWVCFVPFIGTHLIWMILACWLLRGHFVVAVLGSLVGNPWTFPFIFVLTYETGITVLGMEAVPLPETVSFWDVYNNFGWYFKTYLWPMTVAGFPMGTLAGFIVYHLAYRNIAHYRRARKAYLKRRRHEVRARRLSRMKQTAGGLIKDRFGRKASAEDSKEQGE